MFKFKTILAALVGAMALVAPATAAEPGGPLVPKQSWTFAGPFGTYDENQLQRGFQVYREVCASCHGMRLIAFRNLSEPGGPRFSEAQVRALAAEYQIVDPAAEGGVRPGVPADRFPTPFANEQEARDANGGAYPPDFSVIAKARGIYEPFPNWAFNYFTGYSEGGPDYIHALLMGYREPPEGIELQPGQYYNDYFPGHLISMAPPLQDGLVTYEGEGVPETLDQYATDLSAFLMWTAEPHLVARKEAGFRVITFLILFAGLLYFVKNKLWANVKHRNPSPDDVERDARA
ncbi:cytochrome c1 [Arsenicitalea aurantiaca]|uniref:Cytochrome c1 n=1 Tax=Arsenicitalea aurantiaca TaxID=1783274 RepID=A0A433XLK1_9HYPH|nr:cytochrome c1 [Arsenicitalea aurantiaca]RUT34955.1 cytochrome c1 [Arsenicitalea aurantiaca]